MLQDYFWLVCLYPFHHLLLSPYNMYFQPQTFLKLFYRWTLSASLPLSSALFSFFSSSWLYSWSCTNCSLLVWSVGCVCAFCWLSACSSTVEMQMGRTCVLPFLSCLIIFPYSLRFILTPPTTNLFRHSLFLPLVLAMLQYSPTQTLLPRILNFFPSFFRGTS